MIVPDVNVVVHAYNADSPVHGPARKWWEQTLAGPRSVGMTWPVLLGFIRIMTHPSILRNPMYAKDATRRVRSWLEQPCVRMLLPGESHAELLFELIDALGTASNLTTDAHLAAFALEYRAEVATTDADFARFPRLRWFNPLAGA